MLSLPVGYRSQKWLLKLGAARPKSGHEVTRNGKSFSEVHNGCLEAARQR